MCYRHMHVHFNILKLEQYIRGFRLTFLDRFMFVSLCAKCHYPYRETVALYHTETIICSESLYLSTVLSSAVTSDTLPHTHNQPLPLFLNL